MNRFIFLDRDGTLVRDTGYPHLAEDYELLPGVIEGLRALSEAGFRFAIITNQSGIGRGLFDEAAFQAFNDLLLADLGDAGIEIAGTFFCPHAPDTGCQCRKPLPGLFEQASRKLAIHFANSWTVGDAPRDLEAGRSAGCGGALLVGTPEVPDLRSAASHILARST